MTKIDRAREAIEAELQRAFERALYGDGMTATVAANESTLDLRKMLPEWEKMLRNFKRDQVTFIVDRAHPGPPIGHATPNEGERIELSWADANAVHQQWPLKLAKVLSEDAAEFVPVSAGFGEWVPKVLPAPPFDVPPEEAE